MRNVSSVAPARRHLLIDRLQLKTTDFTVRTATTTTLLRDATSVHRSSAQVSQCIGLTNLYKVGMFHVPSCSYTELE